MAPEVGQYITETCKMQQSFRCIFTSKVCCANRIFHSVSTRYSSFHSASHSCDSDEGSLRPTLWLPKLSSILQKLAKCSTALHGPLGIAPIDFFTQFLQYTALSTQPATHVAVMREACSHHYGCQVEQYIAETCKMQHNFSWAFRSCANRIFHSVSTIYYSFLSASHSCGSDRRSLQPSLWLPKLSSIL